MLTVYYFSTIVLSIATSTSSVCTLSTLKYLLLIKLHYSSWVSESILVPILYWMAYLLTVLPLHNNRIWLETSMALLACHYGFSTPVTITLFQSYTSPECSSVITVSPDIKFASWQYKLTGFIRFYLSTCCSHLSNMSTASSLFYSNRGRT